MPLQGPHPHPHPFLGFNLSHGITQVGWDPPRKMGGAKNLLVVIWQSYGIDSSFSSMITGWWFEPLWKILSNWDDYSQYMDYLYDFPSQTLELPEGILPPAAGGVSEKNMAGKSAIVQPTKKSNSHSSLSIPGASLPPGASQPHRNGIRPAQHRRNRRGARGPRGPGGRLRPQRSWGHRRGRWHRGGRWGPRPEWIFGENLWETMGLYEFFNVLFNGLFMGFKMK